MRKKRYSTILGSFIGTFLAIIYTFYSLNYGYTSNTNLIIFLISNILYFSLVGFILATVINLFMNRKIIKFWHLGAMLGFIAYLILILFTSIKSSGLLCRNLIAQFPSCSFNQFFNYMIVEGPFPLHLLQVFLILLGMLIGMFIDNRELMKMRVKK